MKITFLGTSHGVPEVDRFCQSILIETAENGYLIDAGAPVMDCLIRRKYDLKRLKAVFITHMHGDHINGLFGVLDLASWKFKEMDFDTFLPDEEKISIISAAVPTRVGCESRVRLQHGQSGVVYQNDEMKVTAYPTEHMGNAPAYGYLLEAEGKKIYISGDLNGQNIDYPDFINEEPVDVFMVECAHFPAERLAEKLKDCKAKRVMMIHVSPTQKYDVMKEAEKELPVRMVYPNDGDVFDV